MNVSCAALNWLSQGSRSVAVPRRPGKIHKASFATLLRKTLKVARVLDEVADLESSADPYSNLVAPTSAGYPDLVASRIDVLSDSVFVDPLPYLPEHVTDLLSDPQKLFPKGLQGETFQKATATGNREEYATLVALGHFGRFCGICFCSRQEGQRQAA